MDDRDGIRVVRAAMIGSVISIGVWYLVWLAMVVLFF